MSTENNNQSNQETAATLLAEYKSADDVVNDCKNRLAEALKARSDIVQRINLNLGKGPFNYQGKYLGKIVIRGSTYFFRGHNDDKVIKID